MGGRLRIINTGDGRHCPLPQSGKRFQYKLLEIDAFTVETRMMRPIGRRRKFIESLATRGTAISRDRQRLVLEFSGKAAITLTIYLKHDSSYTVSYDPVASSGSQ